MIRLAAAALLAASAASEYYQRANLFFQQRKFTEAGEAIDRALQEDPGFVLAWTLRGKLAMAFNRFPMAREAFQRAVELDPQSAYAQFMLGFFYYVDNDFNAALPPLEEAARLDRNDPRPMLYLAMAQEGLARPAEAIALYEKTIDLESKLGKPNPETHTAYGRLLFTLGRYEDSARQVARVLQLDPSSRDGHYEQGRLFLEAGKFSEAAAEGEKALQVKGLGTTDRQIHFLLARAYFKLGKRELGEAHRKQFEEAPPMLRR